MLSLPFFFIHGFTGSHKSWAEVIDLLRKHSYAMDIPGHGNSKFKNLDESYNISDWCSEFYMTLYTLGINKINLCATLFGSNELTELLSNQSNRANAINNLCVSVLYEITLGSFTPVPNILSLISRKYIQ